MKKMLIIGAAIAAFISPAYAGDQDCQARDNLQKLIPAMQANLHRLQDMASKQKPEFYRYFANDIDMYAYQLMEMNEKIGDLSALCGK